MKEKLEYVKAKLAAAWAWLVTWWNSDSLKAKSVTVPLRWVLMFSVAVAVISAAMLVSNKVTRAFTPADSLVTLADVKLPAAKTCPTGKAKSKPVAKAKEKKLD